MVLAGNPNSGKTTLFNGLTGATGRVGNWPGVTVEKKEGTLIKNRSVTVTDLPGIYSLTSRTLEETIAQNYLQSSAPDLIVNVVDATGLERSLYLTLQLLELGIPVILALNMIDVARKNNLQINARILSSMLGCPVVEISAAKKIGLDAVISRGMAHAKGGRNRNRVLRFSPSVESVLSRIATFLPSHQRKRSDLVRIFSKEQGIVDKLKISPLKQQRINKIILDCEREHGEDAESIIIHERYRIVTDFVKKSLLRSADSANLSRKIDAVLTHRLLALPIFALLIFLIYHLSVTSIGGRASRFMSDTLFDQWINPLLLRWLRELRVPSVFAELITHGVMDGFFSVLSFIPQMIILFFLLGLLEECGYMARAAFITDRIFRAFGLSGKSFIPMLIGTGCSVPAIMASRTIEGEEERRMTIITTSFIPCSAKMPVIALIAGMFFENGWWVAPSTYFLGIGAVILSGVILKRINPLCAAPSPFVMELPDYRLPDIKGIFRSVRLRVLSFVKKAGSIILLSGMFIWLLSHLTLQNGAPALTDDMSAGILASVGRQIAPIFTPLGFGIWQAAVATLMGLLAKEEIVGVFGLLYGIPGALGRAMLTADFTPLGSYTFLVFNLLCIPCVAAVGAIRREMNNPKWTLYALCYQSIFAYSVALIIYQAGRFAIDRQLTLGGAVALVLVIALLWLLFSKKEKRE